MSGIYEAIPAALEEVEEFADALTDAYLHCRVWHHHPEPHNVTYADQQVGKYARAVYETQLRCANGCGVRWRVLVSGDGEVLQRRLDYSEAEGYLLQGKGRIDASGNQVLRKTYFLRTVGAPTRKRGRRRTS